MGMAAMDRPQSASNPFKTYNATSSRMTEGKSPGVFPEDYFRCLKENKNVIHNYTKSFKKKSDISMSRFDNEYEKLTSLPGGGANSLVAGNPGLGPLAKRLMMDPEINEREALDLI